MQAHVDSGLEVDPLIIVHDCPIKRTVSTLKNLVSSGFLSFKLPKTVD